MDTSTVYFNDFEQAKDFVGKFMRVTSKSVVAKRHGAGRQVTYPAIYDSEARSILADAAELLSRHTVKISSFSAAVVMLFQEGGNLAEDDLVIEAFRRSDPDLSHASVEEISDYLTGYSSDQHVGILNNVKGIYHELSYIELENADNDIWTAEIIADPYNPGADVVLTNTLTGASHEVQLKATDSVSYLNEHLSEYPDTPVIATEELATRAGVESSGISMEENTETVADAIESLSAAEKATLMSDLEGILNMSVTATTVAAVISGTSSVINGEDMETAITKAKGRIGKSLKVAAGMGLLSAIFM